MQIVAFASRESGNLVRTSCHSRESGNLVGFCSSGENRSQRASDMRFATEQPVVAHVSNPNSLLPPILS